MRTKGAKDKKPRKKSPDGYRRGITAPIEIPQDYNSRLIQCMQEIYPEGVLDINDVPEMERRFVHYLECCDKYGIKVGNMGAYAAIGCDKDQILDWIAHPERNPERASFAKKVKKICGFYRENLMADGKVNPVTGIFWQKNYDGLKDQQEVVVTPNQPLGEQMSEEDLAKRYLDQVSTTPAITEECQGTAEDLTDKLTAKLPEPAEKVPVES